MKIDNAKLDLALARRCISTSSLRGTGVSPATLLRIRKGEEIKPSTMGRICKALGVDPTEIMAKEV